MSTKELYRDDLLNRFASHTFTETTVQSMTLVEFKNGASAVVARSQKLSVDDAYQNIRFNMVGDTKLLPILTEVQRDALTSPSEGTLIINSNTTGVERYESAAWVPTNQVLDGNYTFQGSTKFGGDTAVAPNGAIDIVGTDAGTAGIRVIRFQASPNVGAAIQLGHSRGTESSVSALLSGDRLGQVLFIGDDGVTSSSTGPVVRGVTSENWSGSAKGSGITFETIKDGTTVFNLALTVSQHGYPETPTYTVATLPSVGSGGGMIFVSDETGGATLAFSDGTNWRRVQDRAVVA